MPVNVFTRSYFLLHLDRAATAGAVAELLTKAAEALRERPDAIVHHLALETSDAAAAASVSLTVYCDQP